MVEVAIKAGIVGAGLLIAYGVGRIHGSNAIMKRVRKSFSNISDTVMAEVNRVDNDAIGPVG